MIKYVDVKVVLAEVPDEITLAINLTNCPNRCPGCHSPELRQNIGTELTYRSINAFIRANPGITCIAFMGGDANTYALGQLIEYIHKNFSIKIAWYSGKDFFCRNFFFMRFLDYFKIGSYIKDLGPLNVKTTNQIMYKVHKDSKDNSLITKLENITYKFWK